ncbi:MAG: hypothetical protein ABSF09_11240 [Candidatus Bathyarchaeia archaeon]
MVSEDVELELRMWKQVVRNVLGETAYHTLENIVKRELTKESTNIA